MAARLWRAAGRGASQPDWRGDPKHILQPSQSEATALTDPVLSGGILSPGNTAEIWATVRAWTTIPSLQQILVIGTASIGAELLRRGTDGSRPKRSLAIGQGDIIPGSIGFQVPLSDLYRAARRAQS